MGKRQNMSVVQPSENRCNSEKSRMSCKPTCTLTRTVENHIGDNRWRDRPSLVRLMIESRWVDQDLDRGASLFVSILRSAALPRWWDLRGEVRGGLAERGTLPMAFDAESSSAPPEAVEHGLVPKVWPGSTVLLTVGPIISSRVLLLVSWKFLPHLTPDRSDPNHSLGQQRRLDNELAHPRQVPNNPVMSVMAITQQLHGPREGDHEE